MAIITRSNHPDFLWPGVDAIFGNKYKEFAPEWSKIFTEVPSGGKFEEIIVETSGFGLAPVKNEAGAIQYDVDNEGVRTNLVHTVYALGFQVTEEELEDGQYAQVAGRRAGALARSMRATAETVHANVLNRGFNGAYVGGDGQPLFSTAHPTLTGTFSNKLSVDADLSEGSLEDMLTLVSQAKDRRGLPIEIRGMKLVVAAGAEYNAIRITKSPLRSGTANNDVNVVNEEGLLGGGIVVDHYLTDPDAWFLVTDVDSGLVSSWRQKPDLMRDNDFDTGNARAKSRMRFTCGWGDPRGVYGSPGA